MKQPPPAAFMSRGNNILISSCSPSIVTVCAGPPAQKYTIKGKSDFLVNLRVSHVSSCADNSACFRLAGHVSCQQAVSKSCALVGHKEICLPATVCKGGVM